MNKWPKLIALAFSSVLFGLAVLFTTPRLAPYSQGLQFGELSMNPFSIHEGNGLHYRIFFPFLSWALGFIGEQVVWTSMIIIGLSLCLVIYGTWRKGFTWTQAGLAGALIAFTIPLQFTFVYGGFPDAIIYLMMLIMLLAVRKPVVFWTAFGLSLFTHESVVLLLPFLLLYRYSVVRSDQTIWQWLVREVVPALIAAFVPYLAYRWWVNTNMMSDVLDSGAAGSQMYCIYKALENPLICMREANLLGVLLPWSIFGTYYYWLAIPAVQFVQFVRTKQWLRVLQYLAVVAAFASTFPINLDTTRVVGFILFPMIMLSLWEYFKTPRQWKLLAIVVGLILLTPHMYVINGTLRYFAGWPNLWRGVVLSVYPQVDIIAPTLMAVTKLTVLHVALVASALVAVGYYLLDRLYPSTKSHS